MEFQLTSGLQPQLLEDEQKLWLANAICGAITADGSVAPEELEYLERALSFLPTQADVVKMMQAVKDQKLPQLERFPGHVSWKLRFSLTWPQLFLWTMCLVQMKLTTCFISDANLVLDVNLYGLSSAGPAKGLSGNVKCCT